MKMVLKILGVVFVFIAIVLFLFRGKDTGRGPTGHVPPRAEKGSATKQKESVERAEQLRFLGALDFTAQFNGRTVILPATNWSARAYYALTNYLALGEASRTIEVKLNSIIPTMKNAPKDPELHEEFFAETLAVYNRESPVLLRLLAELNQDRDDLLRALGQERARWIKIQELSLEKLLPGQGKEKISELRLQIMKMVTSRKFDEEIMEKYEIPQGPANLIRSFVNASALIGAPRAQSRIASPGMPRRDRAPGGKME